jgi:hypothetical protein
MSDADEFALTTGEKVGREQIKDYFDMLLKAERSGEEFPVDLDTVWSLIYPRKGHAKRALVNDFLEGIDYVVVAQRTVNQAGRFEPEKVFMTLTCFEFLVARKKREIFEIYRQCRIELAALLKTGLQMPYHLRRYVANQPSVPMGYFSILSEMSMRLIAPLEIQGYTIPENMVPDISVGRIFCRWLREARGVDPDSFPNYSHKYEDGRVIPARLYPLSLLSDFVTHFQNEWLANRAEKYFKERDESVVELLPKLLRPAPSIAIAPTKPVDKLDRSQ